MVAKTTIRVNGGSVDIYSASNINPEEVEIIKPAIKALRDYVENVLHAEWAGGGDAVTEGAAQGAEHAERILEQFIRENYGLNPGDRLPIGVSASANNPRYILGACETCWNWANRKVIENGVHIIIRGVLK